MPYHTSILVEFLSPGILEMIRLQRRHSLRQCRSISRKLLPRSLELYSHSNMARHCRQRESGIYENISAMSLIRTQERFNTHKWFTIVPRI